MEEYFGASPKLQAAAFYLRYKVFVLEQHISPDLEFDSLDTPDRQYLFFLRRNFLLQPCVIKKSMNKH